MSGERRKRVVNKRYQAPELELISELRLAHFADCGGVTGKAVLTSEMTIYQTRRLCELKDLCWGGSEGEQSLIIGE